MSEQLTLEWLSDLLRQPDRWPDGFEWDYGDPKYCAIGLCEAVLGTGRETRTTAHMARLLQIKVAAARKIFLHLEPWYMVTPEDVALALDRYRQTGKVSAM